MQYKGMQPVIEIVRKK